MGAWEDDFDRFFDIDPFGGDDDRDDSGHGVFILPRGLDGAIDPRDPVWQGGADMVRVAAMSDERLRNVMRWIERRIDEHPMREPWLRVLRAEAHKRPGFFLPDDPFRNITVDTSKPIPEIDKSMSTAEALTIAIDERFGEEQAPLASWLACEAFEARFDPQRCRALKAAARIVGAAVPSARRRRGGV